MEDAAIVRLYWQRDEAAIRETREKYSAYLRKIAWQILANHEDCEESVNDTYFRAWNSMPPQKPGILSIYLGKLTRQLSIDLYRRKTRVKRGGSEYALSLTELEDCVSGGDSTREGVELSLLGECITGYLRGLPPDTRTLFIERYWFLDPVREIAARRGLSEAGAKSALYRARQGLLAHLKKEGFQE